MKTLKRGLALAAAILAGIAGLSSCKEGPDAREAAISNIMTRTSVRSYLDKAVEPEKVETLLRAGMAAPTAVNKQPWHFVVITDKAEREQLAGEGRNARMMNQAPLLIVVCGNLDKAQEGIAREYWVQDTSAATENILLAANALGLGAVWTGIYPIPERVSRVSETLRLPANLVPLCTIVIGYPDCDNAPKDKWNVENVSYGFFK